MLGYIEQFGLGRQFQILITDNPEVPKDLKEIALGLRTVFIGPGEVKGQIFDELLIHSYFKFDLQIPFILSFEFESLSLYSDGLRNGFYGLPTIDTRLKKLIYFGFKLTEKSFESSMPQTLIGAQRETVSFTSMEIIWNKIQKSRFDRPPFEFKSTDLLLAMRYWDVSGPTYQFANNRTLLGYLKEEFLQVSQYSRLIYRAHPWFPHQIKVGELENLVGKDVEVILWEEAFGTDPVLPEAYEPESVIYSSTKSPGLFFGFDSSLNILVAEKWPTTRIIWPDSNRYSNYFNLSRSSRLVDEQINMMKEYELKSKECDPVSLSVDGYRMSEIISATALQMAVNSKNFDFTSERDALTQERDALTQERDALTQERDALTQERDALTQERDALTQERDALTQERDALKNSTIWRLTEPLRKIRNILKN